MKIAQVTMTMFSICGGIVCAETALPLSVLDPDSTSMYLSEEASASQYVFKAPRPKVNELSESKPSDCL